MTLPFIQSAAGAEPVIVEGLFPASAERLFRAWTDALALKSWFGPAPEALESVEVDLRVGGEWSVSYLPGEAGQDRLNGSYETIEPCERLAFTWQHHRQFDNGRCESTALSLVTISFIAQGGSTKVRLVHSQIQRKEGRLGVSEGWSGSFARLSQSLSL
ncbi:MAG: SRPBCC family protein [Pseudomonadales bacterium]